MRGNPESRSEGRSSEFRGFIFLCDETWSHLVAKRLATFSPLRPLVLQSQLDFAEIHPEDMLLPYVLVNATSYAEGVPFCALRYSTVGRLCFWNASLTC